MRLVQVSIPGTFSNGYDYQIADTLSLELGMRVKVPFRGQMKIGLVSKLECQAKPNINYKEVEEALEEQSIVSTQQLEFFKFIAHYYHVPLSEVLKLALPKEIRLGKELFYDKMVFYKRTEETTPPTGNKQKALFEYMDDRGWVSESDLKREGFAKAQLKALLAKNLLSIEEQECKKFSKNQEFLQSVQLSEQQLEVVASVKKALGNYQAFLLDGVTGSGKTEVYLELAKETLMGNKQVLILIPEIGLTPHFFERVRKRIAEPTLLVHSGLSEKERRHAFIACLREEVRVVIGTRTALFLPLEQLGLVIVDEEHDLSFKQQEGVRYSARDMAVYLAKQRKIPILLGSATPSLESLNNVQTNKYQLLKLTKKALSQTPLYFQIIDLRNKRLQAGLSDEAISKIAEHIGRGEQVLVFLNRRGFAPVYMCHQCGKAKGCANCSSNLILHQGIQKLCCHHCGFKRQVSPYCETCKTQSMISLGVGTEQVSEFLQETFDDYKVLRIDRDIIKNKKAFDDALIKINQGDADILVGTQMLAKGHHFKHLTLVVMLELDLGFHSPDFRAIERLGQLITQVAGRAGRESLNGTVLLQTHLPQQESLLKLIKSGYGAFSKELLQARNDAMLPPFTFQALVKVVHRRAHQAEEMTSRLAKVLCSHSPYLMVLGPAPSLMEKKAGFFQWHLALISPYRRVLSQALELTDKTFLSQKKDFGSIRLFIDVDPLVLD